MTLFHLSRKSSNIKTGPIPVSTSPESTCPSSCPFKKAGCYAESGKLAMHWRKVTEGQRGVFWKEFLSGIRSLPAGQVWRHNQAGDLPGIRDRINRGALRELVRANKGRRGFTYTHKPPTAPNLAAVREANSGGFVVNLSANNLAHADRMARHKLPMVVVLPAETEARSLTTPQGRKVVVCPATRSEVITCSTCRLCAKGDRDFIVGFPAHGPSKRKASAVACEGVKA